MGNHFSTTTGDSLSSVRTVTHRGERCGYIQGDTFIRNYNTRLHVLRKINALSFHREVIAQLNGVRWLLAVDETGRQRWARLEQLVRDGIAIRNAVYGAQIALPLRHWKPKREDEPQEDQGPTWAQEGLL